MQRLNDLLEVVSYLVSTIQRLVLEINLRSTQRNWSNSLLQQFPGCPVPLCLRLMLGTWKSAFFVPYSPLGLSESLCTLPFLYLCLLVAIFLPFLIFFLCSHKLWSSTYIGRHRKGPGD